MYLTVCITLGVQSVSGMLSAGFRAFLCHLTSYRHIWRFLPPNNMKKIGRYSRQRECAPTLGEHLAEFTKNKFSSYPNFHIVNSDFETHDFGQQNFDLVYSAATIQWIPEEVGFPKVYDLLKSGGTFAMMMTRTDYKTPNEEMFAKIQDVYSKYFYPAYNYSCSLAYSNVDKHGFVDFECRNYHKARELNADEFVLYIGTHCDHIALEEPLRTSFFDGIRNVILGMGNKILLNDNIVLYLAKKPYSPI